MRDIFEKLQGLRVQVHVNAPSEQNAVISKNSRTLGGSTLANFVVAPPQRALFKHAIVVAPKTSLQSRSLQLRKKGIYSRLWTL